MRKFEVNVIETGNIPGSIAMNVMSEGLSTKIFKCWFFIIKLWIFDDKRAKMLPAIKMFTQESKSVPAIGRT